MCFHDEAGYEYDFGVGERFNVGVEIALQVHKCGLAADSENFRIVGFANIYYWHNWLYFFNSAEKFYLNIFIWLHAAGAASYFQHEHDGRLLLELLG